MRMNLKEAAKYLGTYEDTLRKALKKGLITGTQKENGRWELTEEDLKPLAEHLAFFENSLSLKQAISRFNLSEGVIRSKIAGLNEEEVRMVQGRTYIKKTTLERIAKEVKDSHVGYTSLNEIYEKTGVPNLYILAGIKQGLITEFMKSGRQMYLKNEIIADIVEEYNYKENSYSRAELAAILEISKDQLQDILPQIEEIIVPRQIRASYQYNKETVRQKIAEAGGNSAFYNICKCMQEKANHDYIALSDIPQFYDFKKSSVREAIRRGILKDVLRTKQVYVSKAELDSVVEVLKKSISVSLLRKKIAEINGIDAGPNSDAILRFCPGENVEIFKYDLIGKKHLRIKTEDPEQFVVEFSNNVQEDYLIRTTKNPYDKYNLLEQKLTLEQRNNCPFTIKTYKEFVFDKLNTTKRKEAASFAQTLFNTLNKMTSISSVEIYSLSDEGIKNILTSGEIPSKNKVQISEYLRFLKLKYPEKCLFESHYNRYIESKLREIGDVYSLEEWMNYSRFLTDVDKHIEKAFEEYSYAKRWLYAILHFSVDWRSQDFLETPALEGIIDIEKYSLDWFKNNEFKLSDAQIIVNSVQRFLENRTTLKTGARKHFLIFNNYVIPTAIALIIAEYHRAKTNSHTLFSVKKITPDTLKKFLGEEMNGFSNRKANRSLITYCYNKAIETEGYVEIAYSLSSYLRSHKPNKYQKAETTTQYIYALNKDGDINKISNQLFKRGAFGWLYKTMIELAYGSKYELISEMTTAIETLQQELSANSIENVSRYLTYESENRKAVLNELLTAPKEDLKELVDKLIFGELVSKERNIHCLKTDKCPFPTQNSCKGCRYSIPTNYSLLAIGDDTLNLLDKLASTQDDDVVNRQKYTFQIIRLLAVLKEAKQEFDLIDPDYFKTFIPLKKIQTRLNEVKETKFLVL